MNKRWGVAFAVVIVVGLGACGKKATMGGALVDGGSAGGDGGPGGACSVASDCAGRCDGGPDCGCSAGGCALPSCLSSAACDAGSVCLAGLCSYPPVTAGQRCSVVECPSILVVGGGGACFAQALDAQGNPVAGAAFAWSSSASAVLAVASATGAVTAAAAGAAALSCVVVGSTEAASTAWPVTVLGAVPQGTVRVTVIDDATGAGVAGATVVLASGSDAGGAQLVTTDAGVVEFTAAPPLLHVSVFHGQYNYVTALGLTGTDLQVPLARAPDVTKAGGFHGSFNFAEAGTDQVRIGIAGLSFPGTMLDFNFSFVIGEQVATLFFGIALNLPRAIFLYLEPTMTLIREYEALGFGGKRVRWGLSTRETLPNLLNIVSQAGSPPDPGRLITSLVPVLATAKHTLLSNYNVTEVSSTPVADGGYSPAFADMPTVNLLADRPLTSTIAMNVPKLPVWPATSYLRAAVGIVGALVPAQGFTPLGLGAASDTESGGETPDGIVDTDKGDAGNQTVMNVKVTPTYNGVEGSPYLALLLAASFSGSAPGAPPAATSAIMKHYLPSSFFPEAPITIPFASFDAGAEPAFLDLAFGATYDAGARVVTNVPNLVGAQVYRMAFGPTRERRWLVYFTGASVAIPTPPNAAWDLTTTGAMRIDAISLTSGNSLQTLFGVTAPNFHNLSEIMTAFSTLECRNATCNGL